MNEIEITETFKALGLKFKFLEPYNGPEHYAKQKLQAIEPEEETHGVTTNSSSTLIVLQREEH